MSPFLRGIKGDQKRPLFLAIFSRTRKGALLIEVPARTRSERGVDVWGDWHGMPYPYTSRTKNLTLYLFLL